MSKREREKEREKKDVRRKEREEEESDEATTGKPLVIHQKNDHGSASGINL